MLSEKQLFATEQAKKGHNLLILGQSGTGKTFLGKKIEENLPGRRVALTATTGIAALNVQLERYWGRTVFTRETL